jgi:hypothetical protein
MSVWQGVAMDSLKFYPCPTFLCPETALWPFQGWPAHRASSFQPSYTPLHTPGRTPMPLSLYFSSTPARPTQLLLNPIDLWINPENVVEILVTIWAVLGHLPPLEFPLLPHLAYQTP